MIEYDKHILKEVEKGKIPEKVFLQIHNSFLAIQKIGDLTIFDVKIMKGGKLNEYYRIRKGNYRAIFYFENKDIKVVAFGHRSEVYKKWE